MKTQPIKTAMLLAILALPMALAHADEDKDRAHPTIFVKDSAITAAIKAKLAAEHFKSLKNIKVDTDDQGIVWLSGSVSTQEQIHKAITIARNTNGVREVKNKLIVKADD